MSKIIGYPCPGTGRKEKLEDIIKMFEDELPPSVKDYTDKYFTRTVNVLNHARVNPLVTVQVFAKKKGIVAGLGEAIALLQSASPPNLTIRSLVDGDEIEPWDTVLQIKGPYVAFAELETTVLGVIARRSLVATNARLTTAAAKGKPVMFMGARHDDWRVQAVDGYAANVGGCYSVSTDANGRLINQRGTGTMPHALIAAFKGDTVGATLAYHKWLAATGQGHLPLVVLVDYHNDVVADSINTCYWMHTKHGRLPDAVRIDTSENLIDRSMPYTPEWGRVKPSGVNVALVKQLRKHLDDAGYRKVGIVVSGGFTPNKIAEFEAEHAPVDMYGVGSSILGHSPDGGLYTGFDFTADIVQVDGLAQAKTGRALRDNPKMVTITEGTCIS